MFIFNKNRFCNGIKYIERIKFIYNTDLVIVINNYYIQRFNTLLYK